MSLSPFGLLSSTVLSPCSEPPYQKLPCAHAHSTLKYGQLARFASRAFGYPWFCYEIKQEVLRLLTHVKVSVRCLFKDDQFSLLVWLLLSLLFLCFHIQKQLILHALAINPSVLIELHLGISNMHHLIVGQVGIKIITSITGGEESNPL